MGTKRKFWYQPPDGDEPAWLFKYPRQNTGEHWAEKIAAEIAEILEIPHARVELAEIEKESDRSPPTRGTTSESFTDATTRLIPGNQIMAHGLADYREDLRLRQSQHTLDNVLHGLRILFQDDVAGSQRVKQRFCEYLVLDAVIGNTDRHHDNWGVLAKRIDGDFTLDIAPTFDHASSLGREQSDQWRENSGRYESWDLFWARTGPRLLVGNRPASESVETGALGRSPVSESFPTCLATRGGHRVSGLGIGSQPSPAGLDVRCVSQVCHCVDVL